MRFRKTGPWVGVEDAEGRRSEEGPGVTVGKLETPKPVDKGSEVTGGTKNDLHF